MNRQLWACIRKAFGRTYDEELTQETKEEKIWLQTPRRFDRKNITSASFDADANNENLVVIIDADESVQGSVHTME